MAGNKLLVTATLVVAISWLITPSAHAAVAFVNGTTAIASAGGTSIAAAAATHTTGNLLVVLVATETTGVSVSSIADTAGNTYTYISRIDSGSQNVEMWYAKNITGHASNVVTATLSASATWRNIVVLQYSGCDTTSPYDVSATGSGSGTSHSTGSAATTAANEVIVAGYKEWSSGTFTAGTNFTARNNTGYLWTEERIVSSAGSYNSTASMLAANNYVSVHATFKAVMPQTGNAGLVGYLGTDF